MTELAVPFCRTYKVSWGTEVAGDYQIIVMVSSPVLCVARSLTRHVGLPRAVPCKAVPAHQSGMGLDKLGADVKILYPGH